MLPPHAARPHMPCATNYRRARRSVPQARFDPGALGDGAARLFPIRGMHVSRAFDVRKPQAGRFPRWNFHLVCLVPPLAQAWVVIAWLCACRQPSTRVVVLPLRNGRPRGSPDSPPQVRQDDPGDRGCLLQDHGVLPDAAARAEARERQLDQETTGVLLSLVAEGRFLLGAPFTASV